MKTTAMHVCNNWILRNSEAIQTVARFMDDDWVEVGIDLFCLANPRIARYLGIRFGDRA